VETTRPPRLQRRLVMGSVAYRLRCPWCRQHMEWAISWIAAWAELVRHFGAAHREVQLSLKRER
jgi:hypothetical protein